ncbi:MAG: hypothetical protein GX675_04885 [Erysipelotrichaceae bacterium]|nr:hypothetical protein [Erysipelotrichaceae bacterium]
MQRFKFFKWKFKNQESINFSLDHENEEGFYKDIITRYRCCPDDVEIVEEGEELPSGQVIWQIRI